MVNELSIVLPKRPNWVHNPIKRYKWNKLHNLAVTFCKYTDKEWEINYPICRVGKKN